MPSIAPILAATALSAVFTFAACSVPSSHDVCYARCDEWQRCLNPQPVAPNAACLAQCKGDAATCQSNCADQACKDDCDNAEGIYDDNDTFDDVRCANSQDVRNQEMSCLQQSCPDSSVVACLKAIDNTCVPPT